MSHLKCDGCRLRLHHRGLPAELVSLVCPGCGSPLVPARRLDEIVGYRAIDIPHRASDGAMAAEAALPDPTLEL